MIFNGFGAAEIEQQGLHFSSYGTPERPGLDSGLLSMIRIGFGAAEIEQQGMHVTSSKLLDRPGLDLAFFFQ